jgi:hypothetical protein
MVGKIQWQRSARLNWEPTSRLGIQHEHGYEC